MPDFSQNYLHWPNTTTCVIEMRRGGATYQSEIVGARKRMISRAQQFPQGFELQGDEVVWNIPDALLQATVAAQESARTIQQGDRIIHASAKEIDPSRPDQERWVVLSAGFQSFSSRWRCVCRKER